MSAWMFPLETDLDEAVTQGALMIDEAWAVQDERLSHPSDPYPMEMWPLLQRIHLATMDVEQMTRH